MQIPMHRSEDHLQCPSSDFLPLCLRQNVLVTTVYDGISGLKDSKNSPAASHLAWRHAKITDVHYYISLLMGSGDLYYRSYT